MAINNLRRKCDCTVESFLKMIVFLCEMLWLQGVKNIQLKKIYIPHLNSFSGLFCFCVPFRDYSYFASSNLDFVFVIVVVMRNTLPLFFLSGVL